MEDFIGWLKTRYLVDARARNQAILREFLKRVENIENPNIIDIGSGLGANFRYLHDRIPDDQIWHFVDIDLELLNLSLDYLTEKLRVEIKQNKEIQFDTHSAEIHLHQINVLDRGFDHLESDMLVANAFFDLISEDQFADFVQRVSVDLLYFTINYNGMKFSDETEEDRKYIDLYNAHMVREQKFGNAMGPRCANLMNEILNEHQFDTIVGPSDWEVTPEQSKMQKYLLQYMEGAISELLATDDERKEFNQWKDHIRQRMDDEELTIIVQHDDIVAIRRNIEQ